MAHFEIDGIRVSNQKISVIIQKTKKVGLWGPLNTFAKPPKELDVIADPAAAVKLERSQSPILNNIRTWNITGLRLGHVKLLAKAGSETWDRLLLDIKQPNALILTEVQEKFAKEMAKHGKTSADQYGYPLLAMVACACGESGFGTSSIFKRTGCPFNLQKPKEWEWPKCEIVMLSTVNKPGEDPKPAPFCKATTLGDAARLWCEWIAHWPNQNARQQLIATRGNPKAFAENLFLVGFANSNRSATKKFADLVDPIRELL